MKIPKRLHLMAHEITVEIVPKSRWKMTDALGYWDPQKYEIKLMRLVALRSGHAISVSLSVRD